MSGIDAGGDLAADELRSLLEACGALRRGHFRLSSGLHSTAYVQCALLLEHPARARRVGAALASAVRRAGIEGVDSVLSPALGGVVIGHEVAAALGVRFRFTERQGADMALRRGFALAPGERVLIVEDVVTTGKSTRECAAVAAGLGAEIAGYAAILDRSAGGHGFHLPFARLLELELPVRDPAQCEACAAGVPVEKPGTRPGPGT